MSEKRTRRPADTGRKTNNPRRLAPEAASGSDTPLSEWERRFEAIFEYVRERDAAEAREREARPKAEIIPFPKARS
jgi:hypothetical protein